MLKIENIINKIHCMDDAVIDGSEKRKFIGVDISEKYCEIAKKRLAQKPLF